MNKAVIAGYSRSPFTMARKGELIDIKPKENSRDLNIYSDDAGLFLKTFNINKSGKEGDFVLHGVYDDTK